MVDLFKSDLFSSNSRLLEKGDNFSLWGQVQELGGIYPSSLYIEKTPHHSIVILEYCDEGPIVLTTIYEKR